MSMHKIPLTPIEEAGLRAHGLDIGTPSQLSDAFRQGVRFASAQPPSQGGEAVEVVAYLGDGRTLYPNKRSVDKYLPVGRTAEPLMTVAQHQRILAARVGSAEPACYQFQGRDGEWYPFMDDRHYKATLESGEWPIRALYTHPADQVEDDLTMVKASRELLERLFISNSKYQFDPKTYWPAHEELRALLAKSEGVKK